jgi:hypothetical protein
VRIFKTASPRTFFVSLITFEKMPAVATATKPKEDATASTKAPSKTVSASVPSVTAGVPVPSRPTVGGHGEAEARLEEQIWTGLSSKKKKA